MNHLHWKWRHIRNQIYSTSPTETKMKNTSILYTAEIISQNHHIQKQYTTVNENSADTKISYGKS